MHTIDLTEDRIFSKLNRKINAPNICKSLRHDYQEDKRFGDTFEEEVRTGLYTGDANEINKKKYMSGLVLNDSCECCGKFLSPLNSVHMLCLECDKEMYESVSKKRAEELIGFRQMRDRRNNIKEEDEGLAYIDLFINYN